MGVAILFCLALLDNSKLCFANHFVLLCIVLKFVSQACACRLHCSVLLLLVLSHKKPGMSQDSGLKKTILGCGRVNINLWRGARVPVRIYVVQIYRDWLKSWYVVW